MDASFRYTRIFTGENGDSFFEDVVVPLKDQGDIGWMSEPIPVKELIFRKVSPDYNYGFHNAPDRQFIFLTDGEIMIETSLGEKRIFGKGDIILVEDLDGKGHHTWNKVFAPRTSVFIRL